MLVTLTSKYRLDSLTISAPSHLHNVTSDWGHNVPLSVTVYTTAVSVTNIVSALSSYHFTISKLLSLSQNSLAAPHRQDVAGCVPVFWTLEMIFSVFIMKNYKNYCCVYRFVHIVRCPHNPAALDKHRYITGVVLGVWVTMILANSPLLALYRVKTITSPLHEPYHYCAFDSHKVCATVGEV